MAVNVDINYTGKFDLPIPIKRLNPVPTDTTSIWDTKANAETYATSGATAYVGQILFVQADNKLYKIKDTDGHLEELGSGKPGFLSYWDCSTGLATDTFADLPYTYKKGDYFRAIPNPNAGMYKHSIYMHDSWTHLYIYIYTNSSTQMTFNEVRLWLKDNGYIISTTQNLYTNVSGYHDASGHHNWRGVGWYSTFNGSISAVIDDSGSIYEWKSEYFDSDTVTVTPHYIPSGSTYTGVASTTELLQTLTSNAMFVYDGSTWSILDQVAYSLPVASASTLGGIKVGSGLNMSNQVLSVLFPTASGSTLGMVKQGTNITIAADGTISGNYSVFGTNAGLVPAKPTDTTNKYLKADGTWGVIAGISAATTTTIGGILSQITGTTANRDYVIEVASDGKAKVNVPWIAYSVFSTSANGLVPMASADGDTAKFLRGDGTWQAPTFVIPIADATTVGGIKSQTTGTTANRDYVVEVDSAGLAKVNVPWVEYQYASASRAGLIKVGANLVIDASTGVLSATDHTYTVFTTSYNGLVPMSGANTSKFLRGDSTWQTVLTEVPVATSSALGGIKSQTTGTTADRDYVIEIDASGNAKVNVPWTDTNTTYEVFNSSTDGLVPKSGVNTEKFLRGDGTWALPDTAAAAAYAADAIDAAMAYTNSLVGDIDVFSVGSNGLVPAPETSEQELYLKCDGTWSSVIATLPVPTASSLGGIKIGTNLDISADGTLNGYVLPAATASTLGGVKIGSGLTITDGVVSLNLPIATASTLGGVKIGSNVTVAADGTISVDVFNGGAPGLVPTPATGQSEYFLNGSGNWVQLSVDPATSSTLGTIKVGRGLTMNASDQLDLNIATAGSLGGVKIGTGLQAAADGTISTNFPIATENTAGVVKIGSNIFIDENGVISSTDTIYDVFSINLPGLVPKAPNASASSLFLNGEGQWVTPANSAAATYASDALDAAMRFAIDLNGNVFTSNEDGLVPAANSDGDSSKFLKGDGTWALPTVGSVAPATSSVIGGILSQTTGTTSGRDYVIEVDQYGYAKVNVPWETYSLPTASASTLGGIKIGTNLSIDANGVVSAVNISTHPATSSNLGGILSQTTGTTANRDYVVQVDQYGYAKVNVPWTDTIYTLPTAAADTLGGIKIGQHLTIIDGVVSVDTDLYSVFTSSANGLVPMSGEATNAQFLAADGTWKTPSNAVSAQYASDALDAAMKFALDNNEVPIYDGETDGLVPAIGSDSTKFLKGDGTWGLPTVGTVAIATTETIGGIISQTSSSGTACPVVVDSTTGQANAMVSRSALDAAATSHIHGPGDIQGFSYSTTVPTAANTTGLKVVVLSAEPATKYAGWVYIIAD